MGAVAQGEPTAQFACCAAAGIIPIASSAPASAIPLRRRFVDGIDVNCMKFPSPSGRYCKVLVPLVRMSSVASEHTSTGTLLCLDFRYAKQSRLRQQLRQLT